jgi:hypothetical protein
LLTEEQVSYGISVEHYIISSGLKALIDGSRLQPYVRAIFGCEFDEDEQGRITFPKRSSVTPRRGNTFSASTKVSWICRRM